MDPGAPQLETEQDATPVSVEPRRPHILKFRTEKGRYVYDANTNRILEVTPEMWEAVDSMYAPAGGPPGTNGDATRALKALAEDHGLFKSTQFGRLRPQYPAKTVAAKLGTELSSLVLEITDRCNLRCGYCIYSGLYTGRRPHGTGVMSYETAAAAVDYVADRSSGVERLSLGFYGGEPLMYPRLIEKVVRHAEARFPGKERFFHLTTNATCISEAKARFLDDFKFSLLVSLDGTQEDHDRFRRTKGGRPTFQRVVDALGILSATFGKEYSSRVGLSVVLTPASHPAAIDEFLSTHELTRNLRIQGSWVTTTNTSFLSTCPRNPTGAQELGHLRRKFREAVLEGRIGEPQFTFVRSLFQTPFLRLYKRLYFQEFEETEPVNGMCTPGLRKLFVTVDGALRPCEKVDQYFTLGDVARGVESDRSTQLLERIAEFNSAECARCWAYRLCTGCLASVGGDGGLSRTNATAFCANTRAGLERTLREFCEIRETKPDAFEYLRQYSLS